MTTPLQDKRKVDGSGGQKKKQGKTLPDIGGVHSLFSSGNEAKGRQESARGFRKADRAATKQLTKGKNALLGDYRSAESTVAATGPMGVQKLGTAEQVERGDVNKALGTSVGAVNQGYNTATGAITGARDTSLGYYDPYAKAGQAGSQSYADALGLNGQQGIARSRQQFQTGPGYQFALDQGLTGIERTAAARGELGGGGTTLDQIKYSQGLANQEWNNYLGNLQKEQELGYSTAGAQAGITTNAGSALSNLATGRGTALANLQTGAGQSLADINQQIATRQVAAATDAATKAAAIRQGMGEAKSAYYSGLANLDYSKYLGIAGARNQYQGSKDQTGANVFNGVTSAAKTASDIFKPTYSVAG
jgi:hypothetical protein